MALLGPDTVGVVVIGNGTASYPTQLVQSMAQATRIKNRWNAKSAGSVTATLVPVYTDGTTAGGNVPAKTYLQSRSLRQLQGFGRPLAVALALKT